MSPIFSFNIVLISVLPPTDLANARRSVGGKTEMRTVFKLNMGDVLIAFWEDYHRCIFYRFRRPSIAPIPCGNLPPGFDPSKCRSVHPMDSLITLIEDQLKKLYCLLMEAPCADRLSKLVGHMPVVGKDTSSGFIFC
ncbi:hypothetical protein Vadar_001894 [Vaccinium darrowii]|uniref:Uncharacterized protein n=1 Tax=Vaccinium darrowii TaxID=229202 RepID=A0ACB7XF11_9ERIC|nr:hypothetical protein Vadar_001894 [Vaccinium darrowii]